MNNEFLINLIRFLEVVSKIKKAKDRNIIMKALAEDQKVRHTMKEISINLLKRKLPVTNNQVKQLRKFKSAFVGLAKRGNSKRQKINLIKQTGGSLPVLIPILATLVSSLIG